MVFKTFGQRPGRSVVSVLARGEVGGSRLWGCGGGGYDFFRRPSSSLEALRFAWGPLAVARCRWTSRCRCVRSGGTGFAIGVKCRRTLVRLPGLPIPSVVPCPAEGVSFASATNVVGGLVRKCGPLSFQSNGV